MSESYFISIKYDYKSEQNCINKFVAKFLKHKILLKDIPTFLGLNYSEASLIILYLVVLGISIKNRIISDSSDFGGCDFKFFCCVLDVTPCYTCHTKR